VRKNDRCGSKKLEPTERRAEESHNRRTTYGTRLRETIPPWISLVDVLKCHQIVPKMKCNANAWNRRQGFSKEKPFGETNATLTPGAEKSLHISWYVSQTVKKGA